MRTSLLILLSFAILALPSCSKNTLKGKQSPIGEVGNTFTASGLPGVTNTSASIIALEGDVSTIMVNAELVNPDLQALATYLAALFPDEIQVTNNMITATFDARFTSEGISGIYRDGAEMVYCRYNDGVGTEYTTTSEGYDVSSTITYKSTDDDYSYGFFNIKVSEAQLYAPLFDDVGLDQLSLFFNHRFGIVGFYADFGANGSNSGNIFSAAEN